MNQSGNKNLPKKNSLLQKMLISIVCLLCIPLLCIQVFSFFKANRELEKNNTAHYMAMLQSLAVSFENEIDALAQTASHISANKDVEAPLKGEVSEYMIDAAASALNNYNSAHPLIDAAGIYYRTIDTVLYDAFQKGLAYFSDLFYTGDSAGRGKLEQFFKQTEAAACFATGSFDGCLNETLIVAVPVSIATAQDAVVFFTVDMSVFEKWCSVFVSDGSCFVIMAADNKYLLVGENDTAQVANDPDFQDFLSDPQQKTFIHTTDGNADIFYKYHDPAEGSVVLVAVPREAAERNVLQYAGEMKQILAVTVMLICVLVSIILYINYMPILRFVKRCIQSNPHNQRMSELELIESHFLAQDEQINDQRRLIASFIVSDILCGVNTPLEDTDRYFPKTLYRSFAVVTADLSLTTDQSAQIVNDFEQALGGKLIITKVPNRSELVFVRASDAAIDIRSLKDSLQGYIEAYVSEPSSFQAGMVVSELNQIQLSYYEAVFADKLTGFLLDGEENEKASDLIQKFEGLLLSGKHVKALQFVDQLEENEQELRASIKSVYYYKIIHTYLSALQRSGVTLNNEEIDQLLCYKNSEQMFSNLRRSIISLPTTKEVLIISPQEKQERLLAYVDKNYLDNTICLTSVADYMQTSIYTISRLFKEITGQGFKEYVMNKRLQKACSMLESSTLAVSEIASVCGFEDANYFTIVFKRKYGMPPSKYREEIASKVKQDEVPSK